MYSVAQILNPDFTRSWHEAVAVVQEAASQLVPGVSLPAPDDLLIDSSGTLSFGFGSEGNENPVAALAGLLQELLKGVDAPPSLVELANANAGPNPASSSVETFVRALAFFERPNRANDLRSMVSRLNGGNPKPSNTDEFERLRERVMAANEPPAAAEIRDEPQPAKPKVPARVTRQQRLVAAGIAAGLLIGILAVKYPIKVPLSFGSDTAANAETSAASPTPAPVSTAADTSQNHSATRSPKRVNEPVERPRQGNTASQSPHKSASGTARADSPGPAQTESAPSGSSATAVVPQPGLASRSLSPPTVRTEPVTVPPPVQQVPPPNPSPLTQGLPSASVAQPASGVYSPETPGVKPPTLVRPQMPREPQPGDDTGYFDMIVDEKGLVQQVKLISPRRRYHDRMLVAAAKAWQFSPATLDGQPVKYRILVPIILSGLPY
jgi:hypothetical protein